MTIAVPQPRWRRAAGLLLRYVTGQLGVQAINLVIGLAAMRWLTVEEYAKFGAAFAFQCTIGMLIDLGVSNSIVALSGERGRDPAVVGGFLRSARHYRDRMFIVVAVLSAVAFPLVTARQPWTLGTRLALLSAVLGYIYLQRSVMYAAPLLIHRKLKAYFSAQLGSSAFRLVCMAGLWLCGGLNAITAAWTASLTCGLLGWFYLRQARPYIAEPSRAEPEFNRQTLKFLLPQAPAVVFTAFQSQITAAVIVLFGTERSLAEVSALGRLGQLFLLLNAMNGVLIEPFVARTPSSHAGRRFLQVSIGAAGIGAVLSVLAFLVPGPLVMLLGPRYAEVRPLVPWVVVSACVGYVGTALYVFNTARRYRFYWYSATEIVLVLSVQVLALCLIDVSRTAGAVYFAIATNAAVAAAHLSGAVVGLLLERRRPVAESDTPAGAVAAQVALAGDEPDASLTPAVAMGA